MNNSRVSWNKGTQQPRDEDSPNWKGDNIGYIGIHLWLHRIFGKANHCEQCGLDNIPEGKKRFFDYALLKGRKYERKRENFWQLCMSCHRKYDGVLPNSGNFQKGHKLTESQRSRISEIQRTRIRKPFTLEHRMKLSIAHIGKSSWLKGKKVDRIKYPTMGNFKKG